MLGGVTVFVSLGFLYFGICDLKAHRSNKEDNKEDREKSVDSSEKQEQQTSATKVTAALVFLVVLMAFFHLTYATLEGIFNIYLTPFGVKSALHLSRQGGAHLSAAFWGAFTASRFVGIFVSAHASPSGKDEVGTQFEKKYPKKPLSTPLTNQLRFKAHSKAKNLFFPNQNL